MDESEELNGSSSEEMQLHIAESPKRKRKKRTKHFSNEDFEDFKKLDKTIEETIGKCKNLTSDAARKMLYKLVKNDHVLALTLLKAEEEQKREEECSRSHTSDEEVDQKSENDLPVTPKLTRLKAKQLNKQLPLPELSLTTPKPDDEVVKLISEELKSDEEDDEEYQPDGDSDGDITNTTFSDIDSQPSTPGCTLISDSPQKAGEFKVPRTPLTAEEQENIARRTRSKLCLQTTSIETIESTFIPPDIDLEMYDFDMYENEDDNEWKEFLNEFMMPLTGHSEEIDDDADPEYVAAETEPLDKEELKPVRVSKKELNQLISELLEDSCDTMFENEKSYLTKAPKRPPKTPPSKLKPQLLSPTAKVNPKVYDSSELNTPPHSISETVKISQLDNSISEQVAQPSAQLYYSPFQFQTPQRSNQSITPTVTPTIYQSPNTTSTLLPSFYSPIQQAPSPFQNVTSPASILVLNQNQLEIRPLADGNGSFNSNSIMSQGYYNNGFYTLPQFQTVVVQVPTIDLLQNGLNFPSPLSVSNASMASPQLQSSNDCATTEANLTDDSKQQVMKRESKLAIFDYLNHEPPPKAMKFNESPGKSNGVSFSDEQKQIFENQFRMHCQMITQNYLQFYAHPNLWELAEAQKEKLLELEGTCPPNNKSHFNECVKLCIKWEKELEENNEENKKYMEFLHDEVQLDEESFKEHKFFKGRFHNRLMEACLQSKAIMYVSLLPKIPFRAVKFTKIDPTMSELKLIALAMEHANDKLYQELNSLNPIRLREPKITSIASEVVRNINSFRGHKCMLKLIETYKSHSLMNPIKYYFQHKRAPSVKHGELENMVFENAQLLMNLRRGVLPKLWENYKFSYERLQIYPFAVRYDERISCENNDEVKDFSTINKENKLREKEEVEGEKTAIVKNILKPQKINLNDRFQLEILCDEIPKVSITLLTEEQKEKSSSDFSSGVCKRNPSLKNWQKSNEEKQKNLTSILKKVTSDVENKQTKRKTVNFLLPNDSKEVKNSSNFTKAIKASFIINRKKFRNTIEDFFKNISNQISLGDHETSPIIRHVFIRVRSFDIYWQLVQCNIMLSKKVKQDGATATNGSSENFVKPKRPISSEEYSKKINRKLEDYRALIMQDVTNTIDKDCSFALNYLERVKKTLHENGDEQLFSQFTKMLTAFNPEMESVPELYYKMESLLLPNYADLLDLFLNFLLPEHAAEIGKFCEHFLLTNMSSLVEKLNFFFRKQPSTLKKVYACINELSNEQDLTIEGIKQKILPLLKGNQLLIDWFMELFDRPPDSNLAIDEYETLHLKKPTNETEIVDDEYEEMQSQDFVENDNNNIHNFPTCGVKYINGKIMYRCKTLLPAKISFLANEMSSDEKAALKNGGEASFCSPHSLSSPCVHEIRKHVQFMEGKRSTDEETALKVNKKKKSSRKYKVCDSQTLRAHAIRLNSIHAQNGEKMSDVMHLLEANTRTNGNQESPKKLSCRSSKKSIIISPKKILKSPSSSSSSDISTTNYSSPSPTKALDSTTTSQPREEVRKVKTTIVSSSSSSSGSGSEDQPLKKQKFADSSDQQQSSSENNLNAWTREEDKTILEEIKDGSTAEGKDRLIDKLAIKLEQRNRDEICERYEFLLNFVTFLTSSG